MALHHVQDTERLLRSFRDHLEPGGQLALADLDTAGVSHSGFDREELRHKLEAADFEAVRFQAAVEVAREGGRTYSVFFVTARVCVGPTPLS